MYFTNINNSELSQYHNKAENNFSRALQSILDEDEPNLFKVEDINGDILKIYPLFYCEEISSSNDDDKIIENKCVICVKNTDTRLYFKTERDYIISALNCSYYINDYNFAGILGTVYDEKGNSIEGAEVTVEYMIYPHQDIITKTTFTDYDGLFYFGIGKRFYKKSISINYNGLKLVI